MQLPDAEHLVATLADKIRELAAKERIALVGIHSGGAWLAERLHPLLGSEVPFGTLDISFYRDDFEQRGLHTQIKPSHIPFEVEGRHILLIDDVLYTGRTIRGAMNELFDYGRPAKITLAVLVDRGGREMPVEAQIAAAKLDLAPTQSLELLRDESGVFSFKLNEKK
ncbi:MAG: bifunctional pyr operon transcriptional regulator/uracil phosphoribosyltransferase PyrR [Methylobacillus sp.]|jgi:pyrimidine operon attenuation protein/uracil phosphoribosyltransferase|nr:bifunctional pyr operon transcriptional regulator/uracil phosphoribosyltransferase PyrR [Methylobacillus sp.]